MTRTSASSVRSQTLRLGYPPTADHVFKWFALVDDPNRIGPDGEPMGPRVDTGPFTIDHVVDDIDGLSERAEQGELEVTAVAASHYPAVADRYAIAGVGGTLGDRYGPLLVGRQILTLKQVREHVIAVPGTRTTPFLVLSLLLGPGQFDYQVQPPAQIANMLSQGEYEAGLINDESQVSYFDQGLREIQDLGDWWKRHRALPLPLELMVIRRDLERPAMKQVSRLLLESLRHALVYREEALDYLEENVPDLKWDVAARYVDMYVNKWTRSLGKVGRDALQALYQETSQAGLTPTLDQLEIIEPD